MPAFHKNIRLLFVFVALALCMPGVAEACSVCFDMREEARKAFFDTTIFLSLTPLAMIAGVVIWLRRAVLRAAEANIGPKLDGIAHPLDTPQDDSSSAP